VTVLNFPVGQLQANCYFAVCEKSRKTIIIDPGGDADFLISQLKKHQCKPVMVIVTHGHFDHVLGVTDLKLCLNLPFYIHKDDLKIYQGAVKSSNYWLGQSAKMPLAKPDGFLTGGQIINFGQETLQVIHTPGHTPGGICLYNQKAKALFSGDTLFKNGIGRTDFSYGSSRQLRESLEKIFKLPGETKVYPGHGIQTTIEEEKANWANQLSS